VVTYWEGAGHPFQVQEGDVLFIVGKLPVDRRRKLPWEHVALVAESRTIESDSDLRTLPVYGMPESVSRSSSLLNQLGLATGEFWLKCPELETAIGSKSTAWNLAARDESVTPRKAKHFGFFLSFVEGKMRFRSYGPFVVDPTLCLNVKTNCLGFVCSFLEHFGVFVLAHDCPVYDSQYKEFPGERDFPSPGHLARALFATPDMRPFRPSSSSEAKKYARGDVTYADVARKQAKKTGKSDRLRRSPP